LVQDAGDWSWHLDRRDMVSRTVSTRVQRRFRDKVTIALESHR